MIKELCCNIFCKLEAVDGCPNCYLAYCEECLEEHHCDTSRETEPECMDFPDKEGRDR